MVYVAYVLWPQSLRFLTAGLHPQHHLLLGNALGLLLVFRTNTAYDRYWEGRRLWGFMIGRIREVSPEPLCSCLQNAAAFAAHNERACRPAAGEAGTLLAARP